MFKRTREKLKCKVKNCPQPVFDNDYRQEHNRKYHADMLGESRGVPFEKLGAPADPFQAAAKRRDASQVLYYTYFFLVGNSVFYEIFYVN